MQPFLEPEGVTRMVKRIQVPENMCIHKNEELYPFMRENGIDPEKKWFIYFDYSKSCYIIIQESVDSTGE